MSSASATFSTTVSAGNRLKPWNTKPMCCSLMRGRSRSRRPTISSPAIRTLPSDGFRIAPMIDSSVVTPLPDGPTSSITSPRATSTDTLDNACTAVAPSP